MAVSSPPGTLGDHASVCYLDGKPTIRVYTHETDDRWLFDTGAGISVISEDLFNRMKPRPKLAKINFNVTGANKKPLQILGQTKLPVTVLDEDATINVLVCPSLSYVAILGMDAIKTLNLVMNPRTMKFAKIKDVPCYAVSLQTYRVPPMSARAIKVKLSDVEDGPIVVSNIDAPRLEKLFVPEAMATVHQGHAIIVVKNCNTHELVIPAKTDICAFDQLSSDDVTINATDLPQPEDTPLPKPLAAKEAEEFMKRIHMNVPEGQNNAYVSLFKKNYDIFSKNKEDLGRANNFTHNIKVQDNLPIYRKQFRIPEAHQQSLNKQIDEWVKIGIIEPCFSRYNSPIFIVPKKDGSFRFVLDYRALNENSLDDRYNMKDVGECIGEIGRAGSTIFSTMDLTSGFWQLPLDQASRPMTAFTCPGRGQFQYNVLSMGLKGGPGSFQRMMELTVAGIPNVIVYIDDLLVHTSSHAEHIRTLQQVFNRLRNVNLKLNPDKCEFGARNVQYLGFRLTPKGILPGKDKLEAVRGMKPPGSVTEVRQFLGLCNYFRTHVRNFSTIAGPLNLLTSKKAGWRGGPLPPDAKRSFTMLQQALTKEPVVAYPKKDREFHLIVDAATGGADTSGGFGAILGQNDDQGQLKVVAYASRSLKDHERNYTPYLAEMNAAAWAIDHFDVYLRGRKFVLYTDHKPLETLKTIHQKTLNRLQERMGMYNFELRYKKGSDMPADILSRQPVKVSAIAYPENSYQAAAQDDIFCQDVARYLLSQALPNDPIRAKIITQLGPHLYQENEVFKVRTGEQDLIILPRRLVNAAIDNAHGTLLTGHGGIDKTVARIRQLYYWPSIIVDVKQRLLECERCQRALKTKPMGEQLHPLPLCSQPNQRIHCDLFGPLKTLDGKAHVLCITDAYSKYAELCVIDNKEANTVAAAILSQWICRFGIPEQIFTDGGKEFSNKLLNHICALLKIAKNKITPAHPQCNAQVEIVNKSIKKYLATMTENALDWKPLIPTLAFAYNTAKHNTTGFSPAMLMFGYQPAYSTNMTLPDNHGQPTDHLLRHLFLNRQIANKNAMENSQKYKDRHDEKVTPSIVAPGQFVFLDKRVFMNTNEKLEDKWEGPYLVTKTFSNGTLDLLRKGRTLRVNKQRVKPFTAMGEFSANIPNVPAHLHENLSETNDTNQETPQISLESQNSPVNPNPATPPPPPPQEIPIPTGKKRGRPRKTPQTAPPPPTSPQEEISSDNDSVIAQPSESGDQTFQPPRKAAPQENAKFGTHPMVLRQRTPKPTISHLQIANIVASKNSQVKKINKILLEKFVHHINFLAESRVLDEFGLPTQVFSQSNRKAIERRRRYLKSLPPQKRNTLLTGDPFFAFDPLVYEYVWTTNRPHLEPELNQYFEHLPNVPEFPGGQIVPVRDSQIVPARSNIVPPPNSVLLNEGPIPMEWQGARPRRQAAQPAIAADHRPAITAQDSALPSVSQEPQPITFQDPPSITFQAPQPLNFQINQPVSYRQPLSLPFSQAPSLPFSQPASITYQPHNNPLPNPQYRHPFNNTPHNTLDRTITLPHPVSLPQLNRPITHTHTHTPAPITWYPPTSHAPTHFSPPTSMIISGPNSLERQIQTHFHTTLQNFEPLQYLPMPEGPPPGRPFSDTDETMSPPPSPFRMSPTMDTEPDTIDSTQEPPPRRNTRFNFRLPSFRRRRSDFQANPTSSDSLPNLEPLSDNSLSPNSSTQPMSRNLSLTSDDSMRGPQIPMNIDQHLAFQGPHGPQFHDLIPPSAFVPTSTTISAPALPYIQANPNAFSSYRTSRETPANDIPPAPRYVDAYGRPYIQWPPAPANQPLPPARPGTLESLRISDPALDYRQPAQRPTVYPPLPTPGLPPNAPGASHNFVVDPQTGRVTWHPNPSAPRDPSIETVVINSIEMTLPPPLSTLDKIKAFFGNTRLLNAHQYRQGLKSLSRQQSHSSHAYRRLR